MSDPVVIAKSPIQKNIGRISKVSSLQLSSENNSTKNKVK